MHDGSCDGFLASREGWKGRPMRIKLRRPEELFTSPGGPGGTPPHRGGWEGVPLQRTTFSALYLPILTPAFTE